MAQAMVEERGASQAEDALIRLRGFSSGSERQTLPILLKALERAGTWLREQNRTSLGECEMIFEARLGQIIEVYGAIIGVGVELTHDSHRQMTSLCTLRKNQPHHNRRRTDTVCMRLDLCLLEDTDFDLAAEPLGLA